MPERKKPNPIRRNKPRPPDLRLMVGEVPDAPEGMSPDIAEWWSAYWASDLAAATYSPTNKPAITRLFSLYVEEESQAAEIMKRPVLIGSQGQAVVNPMHRILAITRGEIRALEDRFGCNPRALLGLGIQLGTVKRQVEELSVVEVAEDTRGG